MGADAAGTMTPRLFFTQPANGVGGGLNSVVEVVISVRQSCYLNEIRCTQRSDSVTERHRGH